MNLEEVRIADLNDVIARLRAALVQTADAGIKACAAAMRMRKALEAWQRWDKEHGPTIFNSGAAVCAIAEARRLTRLVLDTEAKP